MAEVIETILDDASGAGVQLILSDSNGDVVGAGSISAISYTWSDDAGIVINSREDTAITPANPVTVPLDATDTAVDEDCYRLLTVTWSYTDPVLGATQKVKEFKLMVENAVNK